jgi:hypothetical protein
LKRDDGVEERQAREASQESLLINEVLLTRSIDPPPYIYIANTHTFVWAFVPS